MKCAKDAGVNPHADHDIEPAFNCIQGRIVDCLTVNWRALEPAELLDLVSIIRDFITADTTNRRFSFDYHIDLDALDNLQKAAEYRITACTGDSRMQYADDCYDVRATEARMVVLRCRQRHSLGYVSDGPRAPPDVHTDSDDDDEIVDLSQVE